VPSVFSVVNRKEHREGRRKERLGAGESEADLAASHPRVDAAAIRACLRYAARAMHAEISYPYSARS